MSNPLDTLIGGLGACSECCTGSIANLRANKQGHAYFAYFSSGGLESYAVANFGQAAGPPVMYRTSEIVASDGLGNTFHQRLTYGRFTGRLIAAVRENSAGTQSFNVDTYSGGAMHIAALRPDYIRFEWDGPYPDGTYHGKFECTLSDVYHQSDLMADLQELYGQKSLNDAPPGMMMDLFWEHDFDTGGGLPQQTYLAYADPGGVCPGAFNGLCTFDFDMFDGRALAGDDKVLVQMLGLGASAPESEAYHLSAFVGTLMGCIVRSVGGNHCYREQYDFNYPPDVTRLPDTCAEIDSTPGRTVELAPPALKIDDGIEATEDRFRYLHLFAVPSGADSGCDCVSRPNPPTGITATGGAGAIVLGWNAPPTTDHVTGFKIWRATASGQETLLAGVPGAATAYTDIAVAVGVRYYYWITSVNVAGESVPSEERNAVPT